MNTSHAAGTGESVSQKDGCISLAEEGRTSWVLVRREDAPPAEAFAVSEFMDIFRTISGVTLPVKSDADPVSGAEIVIGPGQHPCLSPTPVDFDALGEEGYRMYADERQIYIAGKGERATLYGVYSFFEEYLGCRWFTEEISRSPARSSVTLPPIDKTHVPPFSYRRAAFIDSDRWEFSVRNKLNAKLKADSRPEHGYEEAYAIGFVHTMDRLIPDDLFDEHPEYFAMDENGVRIHGHYTQRCLTHPDVLALTISKVREAFRSNPHAHIASVSQADTHPDRPNNCHCPACRAIDGEEGTPMGSLLRFVNAVADAIAEEFPPQADSGRRYIDTLAYRYTRTAPSITRPRDNVIIRLCSIECCFSHPIDRCSVVYRSPGIGVVDNAAFVRDMEAWSRIAPNLHIWDYVTNFHYYLAPHANIHVFAGNMRYFARNHTIGVYPEGAPDVRGSDMAELKAYLLAKLQWDLDYDVETGMDEFVRAYCGAGAGPILRYIRELNALPEREGHHMCCYEPPTRSFFTPDFMAFAEAMFDEAQRLAENEQVLQRIRYWRMSLRFIRLLLYAGEMSREALDAEHASFFADMNTFGIKALREGGTFESARAMLSPR